MLHFLEGFSLTLLGDKLYKCSFLAHVYHATEKGVLDAEVWKAGLAYKPLTLGSTPGEIVEHLRRRAVPECTVCPDKPMMVPTRQLPSKNESGDGGDKGSATYFLTDYERQSDN